MAAQVLSCKNVRLGYNKMPRLCGSRVVKSRWSRSPKNTMGEKGNILDQLSQVPWPEAGVGTEECHLTAQPGVRPQPEQTPSR